MSQTNWLLVVDEMHSYGYVCFLMTRAALVPLHSSWWQDIYSAIKWANVFCGQSADHDLFDAYVAYGTNNYTLAHAFNHLRVESGPLWQSWPAPERMTT